MSSDLIMLITGVLGTFGFSILFYIHPRRLPLACLGGLLTCAVYLIVNRFVDGDFIPNLCGALVGALFSEICARVFHVPASVFTTPCIIPLVPGGMLYRTMSCAVQGDLHGAVQYGMTTLTVALGIAAGIAVGSLLTMLWVSVCKKQPSRRPGDP